MTDAPAPRRPRRLLRLSVRGGLVVILVLGLFLGWAVNSARNQRDAVAVLRRGGHSVWYLAQWGSPVKANGTTWWPSWLVDALGVDYFDRVVAVVGKRGPTDAELEAVGRLGRLEVAALNDSPATDAGLVHLESLPGLKSLHLRGDHFTDAALAHLARIRGLETLSLRGPGFTDAGLAHLKALTRLRMLVIEQPTLTDAALDDLREALPHLIIHRAP